MNDNIFLSIKNDVERKGIYYGDISITLKYHDGRIAAYTITTTERKNCTGNSRNTKTEEAPK
jgi:hypothetical protein